MSNTSLKIISLLFLFFISFFGMEAEATQIPEREKICINHLDTGSKLESFIRSVHMNQKARKVPLSRIGILSSLFVRFDSNHNSVLDEEEISTAKKKGSCYFGQATNSTNFPFFATIPLES